MITRLLIFGFFAFSTLCNAQEAPLPLSTAEKSEVVDSISNILANSYVFPDVGEKISKHLKDKGSSGAYSEISDPIKFAQILTEDVRAINNDKHLRVSFAPERIAEWSIDLSPEDSMAVVERERRVAHANNYGFKEVKILDGNIGYLNLTAFYGVSEKSGSIAEAAMNFLSNTDALIIDLRSNGGGSPAMIQLITSYLYGSDRVHLNTFYYRPQDEKTQTWTLPYVPGKRRPDVDVYVLTSSRTFSAAEEFSYNLRNLERATLIGELTGGGAHPGGTRIATERYTVWVPSGRAINPITKTNWEGKGVTPHIEVPAEDALLQAKITAIEKLMEKNGEVNKYQYEWALAGLQVEQNPTVLGEDLLKTYVGEYGPRTITFKEGDLFYQRTGNSQYKLIPMTKDMFMIEEIPYFRIKMMKQDDRVTGILGMYDNGRTDKSMKDEKKVKP